MLGEGRAVVGELEADTPTVGRGGRLADDTGPDRPVDETAGRRRRDVERVGDVGDSRLTPRGPGGPQGLDDEERRGLPVPAGSGRTAFVDALDVAAVSARALAEPAAHRGRAWTVTGPEALTYDDVAATLTAELGVEVRHTRSGLVGWVRHARRVLGLPGGMTAVTAGIYTTARLGLAAGPTDDVRTVLGRDPVGLATVVRRERDPWAPGRGCLTPSQSTTRIASTSHWTGYDSAQASAVQTSTVVPSRSSVGATCTSSRTTTGSPRRRLMPS